MPDPLADRLRAAGCVFAEDEAALLRSEARSEDHLEGMTVRRVAGEPLEQIVGWAEFCGLRIRVARGVFVPRRRSALLVDLAVSARPRLVVDLCCGTGALGAAIAARLPGLEVHAADLDPAAIPVARRNVPGEVHEGDLYDALPPALAGRVDVLVVNAPYVPSAEIATMPTEARDHEHRVALDGGPDGLDVHRRVAAGAPAWLSPDGVLVVETSAAQAAGTLALCERAGMVAEVVRRESSGSTAIRAWAGPSGTMAR